MLGLAVGPGVVSRQNGACAKSFARAHNVSARHHSGRHQQLLGRWCFVEGPRK